MGFLSKISKDPQSSDNPVTDLLLNRKPDVMIGIPSWQGGVDAEMQICLDQMCAHCLQRDVLLTVKKAMGSLISANRNNVIRAALEAEINHVLFIDTDMVFPPDAILQMLARQKPVVSALAFSKARPFIPNMYNKVGRVGWKAITKWKDDELLKVDCIGGAFMLVDTAVFRRLKPPWFASPPIIEHATAQVVQKMVDGALTPDEAGKIVRSITEEVEKNNAHAHDVLGEDYYFAELCKQHGIAVYVDTALKIGHMGRYCYSYQDFADQARRGMFDKNVKTQGLGADTGGEEAA